MYEKELQAMIEAAYASDAWIMEVYRRGFEVEIKSDDSPVTEADKGADAIIRKILGEKFPDYGFLTEETPDNDDRLSKEYIWIVDPVDGTKEFVSHRGEFATCIALCRNHEIVAGVINLPAQNVLFYATKNGGAWRLPRYGEAKQIHVNDKTEQITVLRSVSFFNEEEKRIIENHKDKIGLIFARGAAQKYCMVAEGLAESFIRGHGQTKEWDLAAGDILIKEAGGIITDPFGKNLVYNKKDVYFHDGYRFANRIENLFIK